jgi:hypothetical protein
MPQRPSLILLILAGVSLAACGGSRDSGATSGFLAEVTGAATGEVFGPGLIGFLPPSEAAFGPRPGYYFVADDAGVRALGITFTIPATTQPGTYQLVSAPPLEIGTAFEVRVDQSTGDRTVSYHLNTQGTITIEAFPADGDDVAGQHVAGTFEFSTQNRAGQEVRATGSFDFEGN